MEGKFMLLGISLVLIILISSAGCNQEEDKVYKGEEINIVLEPDKVEPTEIQDNGAQERDAQDNATEEVAEPAKNQTVPEEETTKTETTEPKEISSVLSGELNKRGCSEEETFGFIQCKKTGTGYNISLKNSGKVELDGAYIMQYDKSLKLIRESTEDFKLNVGEKETLQINYKDIKKIEIFPFRQNYMCYNKQLVIFTDVNCA